MNDKEVFMFEQNRIDYSVPQYNKSDIIRLFNSPEYHLEHAVKQVTHFRHMSDLIIGQSTCVAKMHDDFYHNRKCNDATSRKNIYCAIFRNSGYIRPNILWRITELPNIELQTNMNKMFKTKTVKNAYIKDTCAYDLKKIFAISRVQTWEKEVVEEIEKYLFDYRVMGKYLANQSAEHLKLVKKLLHKHPDVLEEFISIRKEIYE